MTDTTDTRDPAMIERDIRRTQDDMSRTVEKIGDQLTPRNILNALLDKADQNDVDARMLLDGARRNPIALGLLAAGAIWLVSDKDSKIPSFGKDKEGRRDDRHLDHHHRDYVSHMSSVEMRDGEDPLAYQRRRDVARSNYFMVERGHDEDDHGFRQRLDEAADTFREKRKAWADSSSQAGTSAKRKGREALSATKEAYSGNPLIGGILAAAVGAMFGSAIPISRQEQEKLGGLGEKARDMASEQKDKMTEKLRDKKDDLVEKADHKMKEGKGANNRAEQPFMIPEQAR